MGLLLQSTMRESNPELAPKLFDHKSASEAAIEIPKNALGRYTIWKPDASFELSLSQTAD